MDWSVGDAEGTDKALAEAEVVVKERLVNQRLIPNPMEARGAAATYEPSTGQYTVWMTSQDPHIMRLLMTAFVFGIPETKMRCIALHVGEGFGTKIFLYHEYVLMAALAERVGRPVKWMETRSENYTATTHGRDHVAYVEIGAKRDGTITALKTKTYANLGGVLSTIAPGIPTTLYGRMLSGAYRIPNIHCQVLGVYSNTGMVDAYRGAGRPEATYVVERAVDLVARELDLDPVDVRRENFIPPDAFPYDPVGILKGLSTTPATTRSRSTARSRSSATRTSAGSRRRPASRAATAGSASRPTWRSAVRHPQRGSAPSARAGAPRCGRAPTSACT